MALEMQLEMGGTLEDWLTLERVLEQLGLFEVEKVNAHTYAGFLGGGEVGVLVRWGYAPRGGVIRAEGDHKCNFVVTGNLMFRINTPMYDKAVETIETVLTQLTERTSMLFVLSFQLESVYAIRNWERGFEWFWREPR